jgi:Fic family protein
LDTSPLSRNQITNHEEILGTIIAAGYLDCRQVYRRLAIGESTARRYINELIERGWLERIKGQESFFRATQQGIEAHQAMRGGEPA